jgi:DNA-binding LacI/PurR family transcriptional regulator
MKAPPFVIRREARTTLTEQIVRGITGAIRSGHYTTGEQLPTLLEMSAHLGVSMMVMRRAVARLAAAGEVTVRRKSGIRVSTTHDPVFKAHVGYFSPGTSASYYFAARDFAFLAALRQHDVRVSVIPIGGREAAQQFPSVRHLLDLQPVDLAVVAGITCGIERLLAERGVRWVHAFPDEEVPGACDSIRLEREGCYRRLARHIRRCGIREATLFSIGAPAHPAIAAFREVGIETRLLPCERPAAPDDSIEVPMERAGFRTVAELARNGALPPFLYSDDDYFTRGALAALAAAGCRVPRDIQIATLANAGHVPVCAVPLTRIEMFPLREAEAMGQLVLRNLRPSARSRKPMLLSPRFVVGRSTARMCS